MYISFVLSCPYYRTTHHSQLDRLEYIHAKNVVHRDIKPANLLMGTGATSEILHLIDFGLAVPYLDTSTGRYFPECAMTSAVVGTLPYASLNAHHGLRLSRRDDIESATYVLLHLAAGSLPWSDITDVYKDQSFLIGSRKQTCDIPAFCVEFGIPVEFAVTIAYARQLGFTESPDYGYMRRVYQRCLHEQGENASVSPENLNPNVPTLPDLSSSPRGRLPLSKAASVSR